MPPKTFLRLNDPILSDEESDITDSFRSASLSTALSTSLVGSARLQLPYSFPNSPSTPDFSRSLHPSPLTRSNTLPRGTSRPERSARRWNKAIDELEVDPELIVKMRRWLLGIAIVEFDVDQGPVINGILPPVDLSSVETENIAFSAFPDTVQFDQGSQVHSFRFRADPINTSTDGFIYGYSHFTQLKDSKSKRGYTQRSVVILTHHAYPALFCALVDKLGVLFRKHGEQMVEAACYNIATWPDPEPGSTLELGFLGAVFPSKLPDGPDYQQFSSINPLDNTILASTAPPSPPPLLLFEASLPHLWSMWECLVLGEPILVFGTSAAECSQAVWWLRDLLRPIPSSPDIRPYFTIHDRDHAELVNRRTPKSGVLLGVTNPFFEKACAGWPHVVSLGRKRILLSARQSATIPPGPAPGWTTKTHKRYISKDRALLKVLEEGVKGGDGEKMDASLALRRHFSSRTSALLVPLTRYLNTLMPSHNNPPSSALPSPFPTPTSSSFGRLKPFNTVNFFASLKAHGSPLPFRSSGKRVEFYERWLKTPAFGMWLALQEEIVAGVLAGVAG